MIVENVLMLPLALAIADSGTREKGRLLAGLAGSFAGLLRSPIILAIAVGFGFALLRIAPPKPVAQAIDMLAVASAPVALFVIGGTLVGLEVRGMIGDVVQIMLGKLLLHPLAVGAAFALLPAVDPSLRAAALTFACVPMFTIYPLIGYRYGQEAMCAAALLATTAASFVTISVALWLFEASGVLADLGAR
jgi:predicted permease